MDSEKAQTHFEDYAIVEVFGHQTYAGFVTTEAYGQTVLFRVDVPFLPARERLTRGYEYVNDRAVPEGSTVKEPEVPGYTKLFGAAAIYALTPCTEEAVKVALERTAHRPLTLVTLGQRKVIEASYLDTESGAVDDEASNQCEACGKDSETLIEDAQGTELCPECYAASEVAGKPTVGQP